MCSEGGTPGPGEAAADASEGRDGLLPCWTLSSHNLTKDMHARRQLSAARSPGAVSL